MKRMVLVLMLLALAGCGDVGGAGGSADVVEHRLADGTRCVVLVGAYKGAIDCDFTGE